jgi:hypothetical protein
MGKVGYYTCNLKKQIEGWIIFLRKVKKTLNIKGKALIVIFASLKNF